MLTIELPIYDKKQKPYCAALGRPNGNGYSVGRFFLQGYPHYDQQQNGKRLAFIRYRISPYITYELRFHDGYGCRPKYRAVRMGSNGKGLLELDHAATLTAFSQMGPAKKLDIKAKATTSNSVINKLAHQLSISGDPRSWKEIRDELRSAARRSENGATCNRYDRRTYGRRIADDSLSSASTPAMVQWRKEVTVPETAGAAAASIGHSQQAG